VGGSEAGTLPRGVALSLFRLVREAMCNALKHSKGSRFAVELTWFDERLEAILEDDGVGIEGEAQGRGMSGMKSRVADLGGELRVSTDRGVRLEVSLPL
jgi:signal transduction histidine kinase